MKKIIFILLAGMLTVAITSCGDDDDAATATKAEVSSEICDKIIECNEDLLALLGTTADNCPTDIEASMFTGEDCPSWDAEEAATCVDEGMSMNCDDFLAAMAPGGTAPASCDAMCGE